MKKIEILKDEYKRLLNRGERHFDVNAELPAKHADFLCHRAEDREVQLYDYDTLMKHDDVRLCVLHDQIL